MSKKESSSFKRAYCYTSGNGTKSHKDALRDLGENLIKSSLKVIRAYEAELPYVKLVGSVAIIIEDMPKFDSSDEYLCRCDAMIEKDHPYANNPETFVEHYFISGSCDEIYFYAPIGRKLERIYLKMVIWNLNENVDVLNRSFAYELEARIIKEILASLPSGNRYLDDMAQKARHMTAKSFLMRYEHELCNYDHFVICLSSFGYDEEKDGRMLKSIWKNYAQKKEGE